MSFDETIEKYDIDVIIAPGDCMLSTYSAAGGKQISVPAAHYTYTLQFLTLLPEFPIATLPISCLDFNGRPVGLLVAAPRHKEWLLIKVMSAWEATFPGRKEPEEFLKHIRVA